MRQTSLNGPNYPYFNAARLSSVPLQSQQPYGPYSNPYSPYSNPYLTSTDPFGGYFRGLSDLTVSYGQYRIDHERARLINQEVERSTMDTRRRFWEEMRLERARELTADDVINYSQARDLSRARQQPQDTDVTSAKSLNVLLTHAKACHARKQRGPMIPLEADVLARINVTLGHGNLALVRKGKPEWPTVLRGEPYDKHTENLEFGLEDAVNRARINGRVDAGLLKDLQRNLDALQETLDRNIGKIPLADHIAGKRFLNLIDDAVVALGQPNVGNYFNKKYEAQGSTIADLVDYMMREGLEFAGAGPGDETAYRMLQTYLSGYDLELSQYASR